MWQNSQPTHPSPSSPIVEKPSPLGLGGAISSSARALRARTAAILVTTSIYRQPKRNGRAGALPTNAFLFSPHRRKALTACAAADYPKRSGRAGLSRQTPPPLFPPSSKSPHHLGWGKILPTRSGRGWGLADKPLLLYFPLRRKALTAWAV
jgi:hypothetical protein